MRHARLAIVCALLLAVAACGSMARRAAVPGDWAHSRAALQSHDTFMMTGRVGVAAGEEGFNARLRWKQSGARSELALEGPLGVGGVQVEAEGETFRVQTSKGEKLDSEAARAVLKERLGFAPPLRSLRYWVLGVPDPAEPAEETLDESGRLATLQQGGWQISYTRYVAAGGGWLPDRLTLQNGTVRVRLIVESWSPS